MPIQLVIFDRIGPMAEESRLLRDRGIHIAKLTDGPSPTPWAIFRLMESLNVFPPSAVLRVGTTANEMAVAKNAGAWALGVTDTSCETGLSEAAFAAMAEDERERIREKVRSLFLDEGADAVIDSLAELMDAIEAIEGLM
jgi:phosphonoacetaldehyde hydrolase